MNQSEHLENFLGSPLWHLPFFKTGKKTPKNLSQISSTHTQWHVISLLPSLEEVTGQYEQSPEKVDLQSSQSNFG